MISFGDSFTEMIVAYLAESVEYLIKVDQYLSLADFGSAVNALADHSKDCQLLTCCTDSHRRDTVAYSLDPESTIRWEE